jgi:hypothetical protein
VPVNRSNKDFVHAAGLLTLRLGTSPINKRLFLLFAGRRILLCLIPTALEVDS